MFPRTSQSEGMHGAQWLHVHMLKKYGAVYMNQFEPNIIRIHIFTLGPELTSALQHIDYFVAGYTLQVPHVI